MDGIQRFHPISPDGENQSPMKDSVFHRMGSRFSSNVTPKSALLSGAKRVPLEALKKPTTQTLPAKPHEKGHYMKPTESFKMAIDDVPKKSTVTPNHRHQSPSRALRPHFVSPDMVAITPSDMNQLRSASPNRIGGRIQPNVVTPTRLHLDSATKPARSASTPPGSSRKRHTDEDDAVLRPWRAGSATKPRETTAATTATTTTAAVAASRIPVTSKPRGGRVTKPETVAVTPTTPIRTAAIQ
eukprot:gene20401-14939_t